LGKRRRTHNVCVDGECLDLGPEEVIGWFTRNFNFRIANNYKPRHTLAGVIGRVQFNAPAFIVSKGEPFFLEDTTGSGTWITIPDRQQEDLRNKIPGKKQRPGAAAKLTTAQQQDKAGPAQSEYSPGEILIPPVVAGRKHDTRERVKHLTSEDAERALLVRNCRAFEKRMGREMFPNTGKLRDFLIFPGHRPELVKLVVNFRQYPLTKEGLEEVITEVGFVRTSVIQTLLASSAINDQKVGNNSAASFSTSAEQHHQHSSRRNRSNSKERQSRHAVKSSTKEIWKTKI
jgi:hypothetical protein